MATIDELMEGKKPGEIKICRPFPNPGEIVIIEDRVDLPFRPFFKAKVNMERDYWYGMQIDGTFSYKSNSFTGWEIYKESIVITKEKLKDACTSNGRLIDHEFLWRYLSNVSK